MARICFDVVVVSSSFCIKTLKLVRFMMDALSDSKTTALLPLVLV